MNIQKTNQFETQDASTRASSAHFKITLYMTKVEPGHSLRQQPPEPTMLLL